MVSLRLLIPMDTFCSHSFDAGSEAASEKYGHHAIVWSYKYRYTRRHNTIKDTLAQVGFRRCGMAVIPEPHNLGSSPSDRPHPVPPRWLTPPMTSPVSLRTRLRTLVGPFYVEKMKTHTI